VVFAKLVCDLLAGIMALEGPGGVAAGAVEESGQWDMVLCSVSSWMQTFEESSSAEEEEVKTMVNDFDISVGDIDGTLGGEGKSTNCWKSI
jgi:hypothetical protein